MANSNTTFESVIGDLIRREGGYNNRKSDRGGETKWGISKRAYPNLDIKNLTLDQAKAIYKRDYWDKIKADALPEHLREVAFDAAVNQGVPTAKRMLSQAEGSAERLIDLRLQRYHDIVANDKKGTQKDNLRGWTNRIAEFQDKLGLPRNPNPGKSAALAASAPSSPRPTAVVANAAPLGFIDRLKAVQSPADVGDLLLDTAGKAGQGILSGIQDSAAAASSVRDRYLEALSAGATPGAIQDVGLPPAPATEPSWMDALRAKAQALPEFTMGPGPGLSAGPLSEAVQSAPDWQTQMEEQQQLLANRQSQEQDAALAAMFGTGEPKAQASFEIPSAVDRYLDKTLSA